MAHFSPVNSAHIKILEVDCSKDYYWNHQPRDKRHRPLTCIIGANCAEATVIVADTRILRGYEATNESKIRLFWDDNVMTAGAGTVAVFDYVAQTIREKSLENPNPQSFGKVVEIVEDSITHVKSRYYPRMGENYDIELLCAGLDIVNSGEGHLKRIDKYGVSENVERFAIIGHGAQYAASLFGLMYDEMLTARETALLGSFVISTVIALDYDQSVGVKEFGPEVIILRDDEKPAFMNITESDFRNTNQTAKSLKFRNMLVKSIWNNNIPQAYSLEQID